MPLKILLAEDDRTVRVTLRDALEDTGYLLVCCEDGASARAALKSEPFDLLLTDVRMPGADGITLFREAKSLQPDCAAILMTAYADLETAVMLIREGADDYIAKPFDLDVLLLRIARVLEEQRFRCALREDPRCAGSAATGPCLIGESPAMAAVAQRIEATAAAGVAVLISGETGTGKELCARQLHVSSARREQPFIAVNCAAIPSELFESEMFGHEKGAFTGALDRRQGRFALADQGTLFLDEVGELPLEHQAKLLRVLESGSFERVGSSKREQTDVWIISASNRDLRAEVEAGRFRRDLFFRLNVVEISMPPLRERREDIALLAGEFLQRIARRRAMAMLPLSSEAMAALLTYSYPGNVRELMHALEHGLVLARGGMIETHHLPSPFQSRTEGVRREIGAAFPSLNEAVRHFEQAYIRRVLDSAGGKRGETAQLLGISRKSLWQKLKEE